MKNTIREIDSQIFTLINNLPHNVFFDTFFSVLSGIGYLGAVWFVIAGILLVWEGVKHKVDFFALIISGIFTLLIVELGIKRTVRRLRPEFSLFDVKVLDNFTKSFSFPSGHATMSFAAAYILANTHKKFAFLYYFLAFLVSFSRIYLGKHYPIDVFVGAFLGIGIGFFSLKVAEIVYPLF